MAKGSFDLRGFFATVDSERKRRSLTWKKVSDQTGISASNLTRMSKGKGLEIDGLLTLATWSGVTLDDFQRGRPTMVSDSERLSKVDALLRADPYLSPKSADYLQSMISAAYEMVRDREKTDT